MPRCERGQTIHEVLISPFKQCDCSVS